MRYAAHVPGPSKILAAGLGASDEELILQQCEEEEEEELGAAAPQQQAAQPRLQLTAEGMPYITETEPLVE
ncbi:hypothetical protein CHLRE_08g358450v5 [Chlamydomonas reinhardtii]|uniref:Uncharacterized protein n=1 Tax=Chlamydomonas reinhardtii TaxID=3055 RepID=A0A2K3DG61_CHLRE|nr:uncharacterized protein CHLRE_08g358450v5 [Chlamydomonas reinhardtii]PNW79512.1 hypothetical protein CHLRE_08g358450v5 [Chlamydomonas reinhardtii]